MIVSVANQKGGVGKTTTSINLAWGLAARGKRTLLVDLDPQGNASSGLGFDTRSEAVTAYDVMIGSASPEEAIVRTANEKLNLLPSNQNLVGAEIEIVSLDDREFRLKKALISLPDYDFIIIDCPPSLGLLTLNALVAANHILVPLQSEYYALEGLSWLLKTIKTIKRNFNPELEILGILLTMYTSTNNLSKSVLEEIRNHFADKVFKTIIPRNVRLSEAPSHGQSIFTFDASSKGATSYASFVDEFIERSEKI